MPSSNCCFLTCTQVSQETSKVVWYSHFFKTFPQFVVIHTIKGFCIVNETEVDVFWNSLAFSMIQQMLAIWSLVPPFSLPVHVTGCLGLVHCFLPMPKSLSSRHLYFFKEIIASRIIIQTKNYRELISQRLKLLNFSQMEYKDFINLLFKNKNFPFLTSKSIKLLCLNCFWCSRQ